MIGSTVAKRLQRGADTFADQGCSRISLHSSSESLLGFRRIESGTAIFPMSCTTPPRRRAVSLFLGKPELLAQPRRVVGETFAMAVGIRVFAFNAARKSKENGLSALQFVRSQFEL